MGQNIKFRTPNASRGLKRKSELQGNEYGKAGKGVIVCEVCHDVFFKKGWHSPGSVSLTETKLSGIGVHFTICPACKMKKGSLYGGKLNIKNIPLDTRDEIYNLIACVGRRVLERNPQDRIMDIKTQGGNFLVTTNNDELAVKLARKINDTFHKTKKKIVFSSEPQEVSYAEIDFIA